MRDLNVKFRYILLANLGGKFYVRDAVCPHGCGYLPIGKFEKGIVTVPYTVPNMTLKLENLLKMSLVF